MTWAEKFGVFGGNVTSWLLILMVNAFRFPISKVTLFWASGRECDWPSSSIIDVCWPSSTWYLTQHWPPVASTLTEMTWIEAGESGESAGTGADCCETAGVTALRGAGRVCCLEAVGTAWGPGFSSLFICVTTRIITPPRTTIAIIVSTVGQFIRDPKPGEGGGARPRPARSGEGPFRSSTIGSDIGSGSGAEGDACGAS